MDANHLVTKLDLALAERDAFGIVIGQQALRIEGLLKCCDAFVEINDSLVKELDVLRRRALGITDDLGVLDIDDRYDDIPDDSGIHIFRNDLEEYNA